MMELMKMGFSGGFAKIGESGKIQRKHEVTAVESFMLFGASTWDLNQL